jgi:hypothetical protein
VEDGVGWSVWAATSASSCSRACVWAKREGDTRVVLAMKPIAVAGKR